MPVQGGCPNHHPLQCPCKVTYNALKPSYHILSHLSLCPWQFSALMHRWVIGDEKEEKSGQKLTGRSVCGLVEYFEGQSVGGIVWPWLSLRCGRRVPPNHKPMLAQSQKQSRSPRLHKQRSRSLGRKVFFCFFFIIILVCSDPLTSIHSLSIGRGLMWCDTVGKTRGPNGSMVPFGGGV